MTPSCPSDADLTRVLAGADDADITAHLGDCQDCQQRIEALGGELGAIPSSNPDGATKHLTDAIASLKADPLSGENEPAIALPEHIGKYETRRLIAAGGMGIVMEAYDPILRREVAIKLITPRRAGGELAHKRLLREARAAAAIEHEHVVPVLAADRLPGGGAAYVVMPLVKGGTLQDRLDAADGQPLPVEEVIELGRQIASGLAAAHAAGVQHRDIKPANILMRGTDPGSVWVADFGIARSADDLRVSGDKAVPGTPQFMSPEQVDGKPTDQRSDLFSFGALLYQLATGGPPFMGKSDLETVRAVAEEAHVPAADRNNNLPRPLAALIDQLLAKAPAARPESATKVVEILKRLQTGTARSPPHWVILTLIALLIMAGGFWLDSLLGRENDERAVTIPAEFVIADAGSEHETLAAAIAAARPGEVVEIRRNGSCNLSPLMLDKPITLRAGRGFEPELSSDDPTQPLLEHSAPLVLEGLRLRFDAPRLSALETAPLVSSSSSLAAANCLFHLSARREPGSRTGLAVIDADDSGSIDLINCALFGVGCHAICVSSGRGPLLLDNVLVAASGGIFFKNGGDGKPSVRLNRCSFHGRAFASWRPELTPVDFGIEACAFEATLAVMVVSDADHATVQDRLSLSGGRNLFARETPALVASRNSPITETLEDWGALWKLDPAESGDTCRMTFSRRLRAGTLENGPGMRPSKEAAERFPDRGIDPELLGSGANYDTFRDSEKYRSWR